MKIDSCIIVMKESYSGINNRILLLTDEGKLYALVGWEGKYTFGDFPNNAVQHLIEADQLQYVFQWKSEWINYLLQHLCAVDNWDHYAYSKGSGAVGTKDREFYVFRNHSMVLLGTTEGNQLSSCVNHPEAINVMRGLMLHQDMFGIS